MKNILVIDGAENCTYDIFQAEDHEFDAIFENKEIIFIEDILQKEYPEIYDDIFPKIWQRKIDKKYASGIHGTIFYEQYYKKRYFPDGKWHQNDVII